MRKLIFGNWKMHGLDEQQAEFKAICAGVSRDLAERSLLGVFPPATQLRHFAELALRNREESRRVLVGGQTCHALPCGAYTGELSAEMLAESGARLVLVGHSERRGMGESDADIAAKICAAYRARLTPVLCVGESIDEKKRGETLSCLRRQLLRALPQTLAEESAALDWPLIVAYEPIWSIGSGHTPSSEEIALARAHIRSTIAERWGDVSIPVLYGGSVTPSNAQTFLERMEGVLVGTCSLRATDFLAIASLAC